MLNLLNFFKKGKSKRAAERLSFQVMFKYSYNNRDYMARLKDISVNGFGFSCANHIEPGKEIDMEVIVECNEDNVDLKWLILNERARVQWVAINRSSKLADYDIGCEFVAPDNETREKLAQILNNMLKEQTP
ncbi:MAG: PilZ domain-containing protein [Desulfamplus sp.]|nr:PilZ domain-containing protein [Desulfamplus sp.]MBF0243024.1 PilZ domain-containing protein [Desulfamplus sp.]MBF0390622.1 PilZ domain-containing protein [Desulfamplus sp.]